MRELVLCRVKAHPGYMLWLYSDNPSITKENGQYLISLECFRTSQARHTEHIKSMPTVKKDQE